MNSDITPNPFPQPAKCESLQNRIFLFIFAFTFASLSFVIDNAIFIALCHVHINAVLGFCYSVALLRRLMLSDGFASFSHRIELENGVLFGDGDSTSFFTHMLTFILCFLCTHHASLIFSCTASSESPEPTPLC